MAPVAERNAPSWPASQRGFFPHAFIQDVNVWQYRDKGFVTGCCCIVLQMQAEREAALLEREAAKQQAAYLEKAIEGVLISRACLPYPRTGIRCLSICAVAVVI